MLLRHVMLIIYKKEDFLVFIFHTDLPLKSRGQFRLDSMYMLSGCVQIFSL